jgi:hypothetical protein
MSRRAASHTFRHQGAATGISGKHLIDMIFLVKRGIRPATGAALL